MFVKRVMLALIAIMVSEFVTLIGMGNPKDFYMKDGYLKKVQF